MFAIVKVGGKQYRVEEGQQVLVDRLEAAEGSTIELPSLLVADGADVRLAVDGEDTKVTAGPRALILTANYRIKCSIEVDQRTARGLASLSRA